VSERKIRQTHPTNQIRLVQVERASAELVEAVAEALPAKSAVLDRMLLEVMDAAQRAELKARRAERKAVKVAAVAAAVVDDARLTAKAAKAAAAMKAAREDDDGEETDDWYQGPYPAAEDE